jgi:hypothetical protein
VTRSPYPLQWPEGWRRTPARGRSFFHLGSLTLYRAIELLERELRIAFAPASPRAPRCTCVITSNLPLGADRRVKPGAHDPDPGVAVYWTSYGREFVIAQDRYKTASDNIRAVHRVVDSIRNLRAYAPAELLDRLLGELEVGAAAREIAPIARTSADEGVQLIDWIGGLGG